MLGSEDLGASIDAQPRRFDPRYGTVKVTGLARPAPRADRSRTLGDYGGAPRSCAAPSSASKSSTCPSPRSGTKKTLWLFWSGPGEPDLDRCWRAYLRRFDIEHTFRFIKNTLGWTTPSLCTPEQADRWSWLIVGAYDPAATRPRPRRRPPPAMGAPLDPAQAHPNAGAAGVSSTSCNDRHPSQSTEIDTPGPGRPKGTRKPPRNRYPAVKKAA